MILKPLGFIKEIVESLGIGISYAYDDLVFVGHNAFLFQFTEKNNEVVLHVNKDADEQELYCTINLINTKAVELGMVIRRGRYYTIDQEEHENVRLLFMDSRE